MKIHSKETTDSKVCFPITYSSENTVNIFSYVIFSFAYKFVFGPLKEKNNVVAIHFVLHKKNIKKISLRSAKAVGRPVLQAGPGAAGQHRPRDRGGGQAHYW